MGDHFELKIMCWVVFQARNIPANIEVKLGFKFLFCAAASFRLPETFLFYTFMNEICFFLPFCLCLIWVFAALSLIYPCTKSCPKGYEVWAWWIAANLSSVRPDKSLGTLPIWSLNVLIYFVGCKNCFCNQLLLVRIFFQILASLQGGMSFWFTVWTLCLLNNQKELTFMLELLPTACDNSQTVYP